MFYDRIMIFKADRFLVVAFMIVLHFLLAACSAGGDPTPTIPAIITKESPKIEAAIGEPFTLEPLQMAQVANLHLTFDTVLEDSRCPTQVQCVEAGWGRITILVRQEHHEGEGSHNHEEVLLKLDTVPTFNRQMISFQDLTIELVSLTPQRELPEDVIDQSEYRATFVVRIGE